MIIIINIITTITITITIIITIIISGGAAIRSQGSGAGLHCSGLGGVSARSQGSEIPRSKVICRLEVGAKVYPATMTYLGWQHSILSKEVARKGSHKSYTVYPI